MNVVPNSRILNDNMWTPLKHWQLMKSLMQLLEQGNCPWKQTDAEGILFMFIYYTFGLSVCLNSFFIIYL